LVSQQLAVEAIRKVGFKYPSEMDVMLCSIDTDNTLKYVPPVVRHMRTCIN
jgi:hypothetical protein